MVWKRNMKMANFYVKNTVTFDDLSTITASNIKYMEREINKVYKQLKQVERVQAKKSWIGSRRKGRR